MSPARSFPLASCKRRTSSPSSRGSTAGYLQGATRRLYLPLLMPFSAFLLASILATVLAVEPLASLVELRNVFEALVFYLIVNQVTTEERATTLVRVLIATTTIV